MSFLVRIKIVQYEKIKQLYSGQKPVNSIESKSLLKRLVRRYGKRVESIKNVCGTCAKQRIFEERPRGISPDGARDGRPIYAYQGGEGKLESMEDRRGTRLLPDKLEYCKEREGGRKSERASERMTE